MYGIFQMCAAVLSIVALLCPQMNPTIPVRFVHSIIGLVFSPCSEGVLESNTCISVAPDCQPKMVLEFMAEHARF